MSQGGAVLVAMATSAWATVTQLAVRQDHVLTVDQARARGVSPDQIKRMVQGGLLQRPERGILRISGAPVTWRQRARIAQLRAGDGAVLAERSAAMLHALEGIQHPGIDLLVPQGHRRRPKRAGVTQSLDLTPAHTMLIDRLPVTTPTRTLVDLGAVVPEAQLEVAVDDALRRQLTTEDRLWDAIAQLGRPGRSGVPQLRRLLLERGGVTGLTETGFETKLLRALREVGLPRPTTQHEIREPDGTLVMRVDAAYLPERLGIEADSKRWHATDARFEDDREKRARAAALGWTIVAVTYRQVTTRPSWVGRTVARTLDATRSVA